MLSSYKINLENPIDCLNLNFRQSIEILKNKIGIEEFKKAIDINYIYPSKISNFRNTSWTKTIKIVGINPRITKTFWGIVKYAFSLKEDAIHIMPLFETGDGSLYVQNSWDINEDFLDENLAKLGYSKPSEQLKLIVNILHAMGKIVGFDAMAHCDNFAKIVLLNPKLFEWVKLEENKTSQIPFDKLDYNKIYLDVEKIIIEKLNLPNTLFSLNEKIREELIFPKNINEFKRRMELRKAIRSHGIEPIPVVEHAPSRPIIFEKIETYKNEDWAVFKVENKKDCAKIFGAMTPYKLYTTDQKGYPKKNDYCVEAWDYFSDKIKKFQKEYNFDFLRADMAHNQTSHSHIEKDKDVSCPELWAYVKSNIQEEKPYLATIAETFYSKYYIDGILDMVNKDFDVVIGQMNFQELDKHYLNLIDDYINIFENNFSFHPCVAIFTNDGDLKTRNHFLKSNKINLLRCFISLFLNLPSYMGIGFELRDINPKNENNYSNSYVKKQAVEYSFGKNYNFLKKFNKLRNQYVKMKDIIDNYKLTLINCLNNELSLCFLYKTKKITYLFLSNLNENNNTIRLKTNLEYFKIIFSFDNEIKLSKKNDEIEINIKPWEFAIYECE